MRRRYWSAWGLRGVLGTNGLRGTTRVDLAFRAWDDGGKEGDLLLPVTTPAAERLSESGGSVGLFRLPFLVLSPHAVAAGPVAARHRGLLVLEEDPVLLVVVAGLHGANG